ncbi:hypothetical protein Cme02nite_51880 [Catellatospora methionotrophica]|uniref:Uncharacterized protein n=1 Tax=Catellatospora methionotrophica TaxID=121620 RepID=A0A8J3PIY0_9ACTN|nr:hypothetical protein Cme02nite_51880 [Catellatospora methionotrophica]
MAGGGICGDMLGLGVKGGLLGGTDAADGDGVTELPTSGSSVGAHAASRRPPSSVPVSNR